MAKLIIKEMATGIETPVEDVDLGMSNKELIDQLVEGGVLTPLSDAEKNQNYGYIILQNGRITEGNRSLSDFGFQDDSAVEIVKKAVGACK
jgi:hypothetical protein